MFKGKTETSYDSRLNQTLFSKNASTPLFLQQGNAKPKNELKIPNPKKGTKEYELLPKKFKLPEKYNGQMIKDALPLKEIRTVE